MKLRFLPVVVLLLLSTSWSAQSIKGGRQTYVQIQDSLFQHLSKDSITSGVLYDRVFNWSGVDSLQNGDTINYSYCKQAWLEFFLASYAQVGLFARRYR